MQQAVITEKLSLFDASRSKELPLKVTFPEERRPCPVIVFSHGAFASRDGYQPLAEHWASDGFVVIRPTHEDALSYFARRRQQSHRRRQGPHPGKGDLEEAFEIFKREAFANWSSRPRDISFILDHLDELERQIETLDGRLDRSVTGVGGHSFGAHTTMVIGGGKPGGQARFADERASALLLISPQGIEPGFSEDAELNESTWDEIGRAMMVITGTRDEGRNGQSYQWRLSPFELSPPGDKYLLVIEGGWHGFGGISTRKFAGSGPDCPEHVAIVKRATLEFWRAHLKGCNQARERLLDFGSSQMSGADFRFATR